MMRRIVAGFVALAAAFALYPVPSAAESPPPAQLKVGGIYGLTGLVPDLGDQYLKGSQLYLALSPPESLHLQLIVEDSRWDTKTAVAAFQKLVDIDRVQVVHVNGSGPSLAIKPLAEARNVLLLSAAAHPQLIPGSSVVIRHANLASEDAREMAKFVAGRSDARSVVATIFLQNEWAEDYADVFQQVLKNAVPDITLVAEPYLPTDTDFRSVLLKLFKSAPSALVISSAGMTIAKLVEQARQLGFRGPIYINNGFVLSREAQQRVRALRDPAVFYQHYPAPSAGFVDAYSSHFHSAPEYFALVSYTDMELLNYSVARVGTDVRAITKFVKAMGEFDGRYLKLMISPEGDIVIPTTVERFE